MLRRRDIELIADLVEGRLEDESEARALIARSEDARVEYEAQMTAYQALSSAPAPSLSESERAALHRDLWTVLSRPSVVPTATRSPWYLRWAPVAAALFVVVGLAAVLTQGRGDQVMETFGDVSSGLGAVTTTAAGSDTMEAAGEDGAEPAAEGGTDTTAADEDAASDDTLAEALSRSGFFAEAAGLVRSGQYAATTTTDRDLTGSQFRDVSSCLANAGLEDHEALGRASDFIGSSAEEPRDEFLDGYLVVVPAHVEVGPDTPITFVDVETCEIAHVED